MEEAAQNILKMFAPQVAKAATHKRSLCNILASKDSADDKIRKIRMSILTYHGGDVGESIDTQKLEKDVGGFTDDLDLTHVSTESMEFITELLESGNKPLKEHDKLLREIGNIIKSKDKTNDQKVDLITDVLI